MIMGFIQSFTYAEIAGLFPNKSGGASVYGAAAWVRYTKLVAPLSVWCNWFAWSPVLSLGCSIAASYIINAVAPQPTATSPAVVQWLATNGAALQMADADKVTAAIAAVAPGIRSWTLFTTTLGPVSLSLNLAFFIGARPHARGLRRAAPRYPWNGERPEVYRPPRHHPDVHRRRGPATDPRRELGELLSARPPRGAGRSRAGRLEHHGLDTGPRQHVHRGLVDLRVRDGDLLHQRVP